MAIEVNGELIDDLVIRQEASLLKAKSREMFDGLDLVDSEIAIGDTARERVIANVLLRQEAHAEGVNAALQLDRLVGEVIGRVPKPTRKEVAGFYKKHRDKLEAPEMLRAAHIVKNVDETHPEAEALAAIGALAVKIAQGVDFAELADAHSDCPGSGGDLGWISRDEMVPEFERAVFSLQPHEISPIFRTIFGFHIARVTERKPARVPPLDEIQDRIADDLHRDRQRAALDDFVAQLRAKATIRQRNAK